MLLKHAARTRGGTLSYGLTLRSHPQLLLVPLEVQMQHPTLPFFRGCRC